MPPTLLATYRVQMHAGFGFNAVVEIADYLAELGVSHVYCSPYLQAVSGSTHGYDVVDHSRVNEELGGASAHIRFCRTLKDLGLGQVLDIVPNHMAVTGRENAWWWDVLENGSLSRYASYFDVDWDPPEAKLRNMVLVPILGDHYGRVLEAGELTLEREGGAFTIRYRDHVFPVDPRSLDLLLAVTAERCGSDHLAFIANSLTRLPLPITSDRASITRRHRDKEVLREQLARLVRERPEVKETVDQVVKEVNADPDTLDALLDRQNYRLAFWRTAERELGYRRFFDSNTLAGLRAEDEQVFADTHQRILAWIAEGVLDGLRIDHPDGLCDPEAYFQRLADAAPRAWIIAEKILEPGERLRESWPIDGTTGYDFLHRVGSLFVDPTGEGPLTALYEEFTGESSDFQELKRQKKHQVMRDVLGSDVNRLIALFVEICERHRRHRDYTRHELHEVLREVIACFPVYRTYVRPAMGQVTDEDVRYVTDAIDMAKVKRPDLDALLFDFLRDLLLLRIHGTVEHELVMRFQQFTGPAMAKGVEDTAFYNFNRLVSLNEVGGDPSLFGISTEDYHRACAETLKRWPRAMLTTSTHDTKRSEDVRARITLLSEIPQRWGEAVRRWAEMNERHRAAEHPDRNAEYLLYQTLVGAWPIETERMIAYMEKASREAKTHTSWTTPNIAYDQALRTFVEAVLHNPQFIADVEAFVAPLVEPGRVTLLSQTLLKLTAPGVPDLYQGTELWDFSLVDPDNRRPVDYARRRRLLKESATLSPEEIWARIDEGLPKLWLIRQTLHIRRRYLSLFGLDGGYRALMAQGEKSAHVVAFARGDKVVTVAPRLVIGLNGDWADTTLQLEDGEWRHAFTGDLVKGGDVPVADLFRRFPVALLTRET